MSLTASSLEIVPGLPQPFKFGFALWKVAWGHWRSGWLAWMFHEGRGIALWTPPVLVMFHTFLLLLQLNYFGNYLSRCNNDWISYVTQKLAVETNPSKSNFGLPSKTSFIKRVLPQMWPCLRTAGSLAVHCLSPSGSISSVGTGPKSERKKRHQRPWTELVLNLPMILFFDLFLKLFQQQCSQWSCLIRNEIFLAACGEAACLPTCRCLWGGCMFANLQFCHFKIIDIFWMCSLLIPTFKRVQLFASNCCVFLLIYSAVSRLCYTHWRILDWVFETSSPLYCQLWTTC